MGLTSFILHIKSYSKECSEVDNRFCLYSIDNINKNKEILVSGPPNDYAPLGYFDINSATKSIMKAKYIAVFKIGVPVNEIQVADYLKLWEMKGIQE